MTSSPERALRVNALFVVGGWGQRTRPLTGSRSGPGEPFGDKYRRGVIERSAIAALRGGGPNVSCIDDRVLAPTV